MFNSPLTLVEFCAGYGGLGLGIKRVLGDQVRLVGLCELEGFAQANLISKMESGLLAQVPIWPDLRTFPYRKFRGLVDIAAAGIPCQPHSHAGKRKGGSDERFLFDDWLNGLEEMRPRFIFIENVEGLLSSKMPDGSLCIAWTVERLEGMGYKVTAGIFSASEVGAPHRRKRVFILAYDQSLGIQGRWPSWIEESRPYAGQALPLRGGDAGGGEGELADAAIGRRDRQHAGCSSDVGEWSASQDVRPEAAHAGSCGTAQAWPSRPGEQQFAWEPPRVVVDDASRLRSREPADGRGQAASGADASGEERMLGNASHANRRSRVSAEEAGAGPEDIWRRRFGESGERQTQPPLGRNADGPADWLDDAELYTTCDNRTDELRLLGNGVVPATAERAFRVLVGELMEHNS